MSMPHFLFGDEYYQRSIDGLLPDKKKHSSVWKIIAEAGATFEVLSVNTLLSTTFEH